MFIKLISTIYKNFRTKYSCSWYLFRQQILSKLNGGRVKQSKHREFGLKM